MLRRHLSSEDRQLTLWQELSEGTATVVGFATLCSMAMLTTKGFEAAKTLDRFDLEELLEFAVEVPH